MSDIANKFYDAIIARNPTNSDLVQIIELCGNLADLKTIVKYGKDNNLSYNGVKKTRNIIELFGVKFVVDD